MLRKAVTWPHQIKEVNSWNVILPILPQPFYQTVRARSHRDVHAKFTYTKMGKGFTRRSLIDNKLLKKGQPVSATLNMGDMTQVRKFEFDVASLNARGFLRFQKAYDPPQNVKEKLLQLCESINLASGRGEGQLMNVKLSDSRLKYELLSRAFEEFQHGVPNSMLHMMETAGDVLEFYCTPISTHTPYEELIRKGVDLPPNLHVQKEPLRFKPGNDRFGQTAFNKTSTIITGLRAKKKYVGYSAKMTWP